MSTPPTSGTSIGKIAAGIIIAFVVILVIILVLSVVVPKLAGSKATIYIRLYSTHILYSVSYTLYVDGELVDSGLIDPGYYVQYTYEHRWSSSNPIGVTISATSTGGGMGSQSDSETLTVSDGGTYSVDLYI